MNSLLATLLSGSGTQFEYTYSIAAETGMVEQADVDWNATDWQRNTGGFRLGYQLTNNVDLLTSVHWGQQNSGSNDYYYDDYGYGEDYESSGLTGYDVAISETLMHIGPKFSWNLKPWFAPYATAQGMLVHNRLQMSDDGVFDEDSTTLVDATAVAFGATGALGLEFRTRPIAKNMQLFVYGEGGATGATALQFSLNGAGADEGDVNIGDLGYGGSYLRFGLGTKF